MVLPGIGSPLFEPQLALSLVGIGWSATTTFAFHANAAIGDLAILLDHAYGTPATVTPSGFTLLGTGYAAEANETRFNVSAGVITSLTPPTGMNGSSSEFKAAVILRPTRPIRALTTPAWDVDVGGIDDPSSSATGSGSVAGPLVAVGYTGSNSGTGATDQTQTPAFGYTEGYDPLAGIRGRVGVSIYNLTGTGHTVDIGDLNDSNVTAAGYVKIS